MSLSLGDMIQNLKDQMKKDCIEPERGLGSELFLFSSTLAPVVNVDLLVTNEKKQILLSWRDDVYTGTGWHVPGGCIRFHEALEERIQRTAVKELGSPVQYEKEPIKVFEIFAPEHRENVEDQRERAHFITLVYHCKLPSDYQVRNSADGEVGQLKWFNGFPDNLLDVQQCYQEDWEDLSKKLWRN